MRVVLAFIPDAEMMTPEIFTNLETISDFNSRMHVGLAFEAMTI